MTPNEFEVLCCFCSERLTRGQHGSLRCQFWPFDTIKNHLIKVILPNHCLNHVLFSFIDVKEAASDSTNYSLPRGGGTMTHPQGGGGVGDAAPYMYIYLHHIYHFLGNCGAHVVSISQEVGRTAFDGRFQGFQGLHRAFKIEKSYVKRGIAIPMLVYWILAPMFAQHGIIWSHFIWNRVLQLKVSDCKSLFPHENSWVLYRFHPLFCNVRLLPLEGWILYSEPGLHVKTLGRYGDGAGVARS